MADREALDALFRKHGYTDFRWIDAKDIVVSQWVRMKCRFTCDWYGKTAMCPPNTPSVDECREFFSEYSTAVIFRFEKRVDSPEDRHTWSPPISRDLLALEREVFLSGCERAFLLLMDGCPHCEECVPTKADCKNPGSARPVPEAFAVDVFSTVRKAGLPIEVLTDFDQAMNRYAILLIE